ncbi:NAD(P)/FAD-dependent oxidoreductase [Luteimonas yindakuii]|uniref:NAD(P)/FAD-dependent oxidoreductase n=1 Tax=Luteimonas yindakuii TaxID=2565782 RepID=UPI00110790F1|nr:NAD(P)/FAD-dependent oxidoreductase [Luteimonas yindakuii]QCO66841.2 NAD(P)/FAD-dependent oxidoreductase [Luteimonas yindakuii]
MADQVDVAIIGGGPAGLTAATYLRRFLRSCVVIDAGNSRARYIPESHNCPGFPQGVSGRDLLAKMRAQAGTFEADIVEARVERIEATGDGFRLSAGDRHWDARNVILATGLADRLPDVPWCEDAIACGALRLCAVCDAYEARDQHIGIHGPADGLVGHARFLRAYSPQVTLLPSDRDLADEDAAQAQELGVRVLPAGGTLEFDGERCHYRAADGTDEVFDTVYPYLGYEGHGDLLAGVGLDANEGDLRVDPHQQTRVPGLYAIGDIVSGLNQISVAFGQAAVAATHVHNNLPLLPRD